MKARRASGQSILDGRERRVIQPRRSEVLESFVRNHQGAKRGKIDYHLGACGGSGRVGAGARLTTIIRPNKLRVYEVD